MGGDESDRLRCSMTLWPFPSDARRELLAKGYNEPQSPAPNSASSCEYFATYSPPENRSSPGGVEGTQEHVGSESDLDTNSGVSEIIGIISWGCFPHEISFVAYVNSAIGGDSFSENE